MISVAVSLYCTLVQYHDNAWALSSPACSIGKDEVFLHEYVSVTRERCFFHTYKSNWPGGREGGIGRGGIEEGAIKGVGIEEGGINGVGIEEGGINGVGIEEGEIKGGGIEEGEFGREGFRGINFVYA